jgi:hypothetical protein
LRIPSKNLAGARTRKNDDTSTGIITAGTKTQTRRIAVGSGRGGGQIPETGPEAQGDTNRTRKIDAAAGGGATLRTAAKDGARLTREIAGRTQVKGATRTGIPEGGKEVGQGHRQKSDEGQIDHARRQDVVMTPVAVSTIAGTVTEIEMIEAPATL